MLPALQGRVSVREKMRCRSCCMGRRTGMHAAWRTSAGRAATSRAPKQASPLGPRCSHPAPMLEVAADDVRNIKRVF
jgi:hypothetical protein